MKPLIQLRSLVKTYQLGETTVHALRKLDLTIIEGEFTALIGQSGSGKSTLLNMVGAIDLPDSGEIIFDSENVLALTENQKSELRNRKIGFIFQTFNLVPVLNVYENIELPLMIQSELTAAQRKERVLKALKDVDLESYLHYPPDKLSGGQRQRVAIARALVTQPKLVLADEPTANLDSVTANKIIDLLLDLNKKLRTTFLFCSHDEKLIERVERVVRIQDGVIVQ